MRKYFWTFLSQHMKRIYDNGRPVIFNLPLLLMLLMAAFGQAQTLSSNVSKQKLALGEKAIYRISINNLQGRSVLAKPKNELLPFHFEEVDDKITKSLDLYTRTIEFQVFDEGTFTIPALEFSVNGQILKTIPYEVQVYNPANEKDTINDIMNNKQVDLKFLDYWELYKFYILAFLILIAALFLFFGLFKKKVFRKSTVDQTPIDQTLKKLAQLWQKKYTEEGNYRLFYVELIDLTRSFLTRQYHLPAEVLLTDDLIALMKETNRISSENEKVVEEVFLRGDLVKFAKIFPDRQTMEEDYNRICQFVKRSSTDLEAEHIREMH